MGLGRGLLEEKVYENTCGINLFQGEIQDQWERDGHIGSYYSRLETEKGCAELACWMNANKNLCLDKESNNVQ